MMTWGVYKSYRTLISKSETDGSLNPQRPEHGLKGSEKKMENLYRYRLNSTGHSSTRFGPCEVCGKHASEVFIQAEQKRYRRHDSTLSWIYADCIDSLVLDIKSVWKTNNVNRK